MIICQARLEQEHAPHTDCYPARRVYLWQIEDLGGVFKLLKHALQWWLSPSESFKGVIAPRYFFRALYSGNDKQFPLDNITNDTLALYSLMVPCAIIMREAHHDLEPIAGNMHSLVVLRIASILDPYKS